MSIKTKDNRILRINKGSVSKDGFTYQVFKDAEERAKFTSEQLDGNEWVNMPNKQQVRVAIDLNVALPKAKTTQDALSAIAYPYLKNLVVYQQVSTTPFKDGEDC